MDNFRLRFSLILFAFILICDAYNSFSLKHSRLQLHCRLNKCLQMSTEPFEYRKKRRWEDEPPPKVENSATAGKKVRPQGQQRDQEINNPNKLKIIGGIAKGTKLNSPNVYLRPMMAKVREALFSTLEHLEVFSGDGPRVLDVFSGSGSVGLEALSRGAQYTTFVDLSKDCIDTALSNAAKCGFPNKAGAVCARAEEVLLNPTKFGLTQPYQLISITPPYLEVSYDELIHGVCNSPIVESDTIVILEYPTEMGLFPHILGGDKLYGIRNRRYGRTMLGIYVYKPTQLYNFKIDEFKLPDNS